MALAWAAAITAAALAGLGVINFFAARRAERRHPPRGKFVTVDGVRVHYRDEGPADRRDAKLPIVLIHGNGASAEEQMSSGLVALLARERRVIAFDRPGAGYSARPAGRRWTASAQAALLGQALREIEIDRAVLVGHSWGTLVALAIALDHPDAAAALVLIAGPVMPVRRRDVETARWIAVPLLGALLAHTIVPFLARLGAPWLRRRIFSPQPVPRRFDRDYPRALQFRVSQLSAIAWDTIEMIPSAAALSSRYRDLAMPVTIIAGTDDEMVPSDRHSGALHRMLPGSTYRVIPGAGHMVHHVATEEVAALILATARSVCDTPPG